MPILYSLILTYFFGGNLKIFFTGKYAYSVESISQKNYREQLRLHFRHIRDTSNPFEIPNNRFLKLFRLNKEAANNLIQEISFFLPAPNRIDSIPIHLQVSDKNIELDYVQPAQKLFFQVFASLLFYAHGNYQITVGEDINIGISQPAMSRILNRISVIIATHLLPRHCTFPSNEEDIQRTKIG